MLRVLGNILCDLDPQGQGQSYILCNLDPRAVTIHRYLSIWTWPMPWLGCCIAILSDIILAANLVISNLKIYILNNSSTFYSYSVNVCCLKQDQMDK